MAGAIHAATSKATPVDADEFGGADSAASFGFKRFTWANLKATLKTYFDTLYAALAHASRHKSGGADAIKLDELAAPTDVTTLNATTSAHGLLKKLGGGTTNFLRADGTWAAPAGGGAALIRATGSVQGYTDMGTGDDPGSQAYLVLNFSAYDGGLWQLQLDGEYCDQEATAEFEAPALLNCPGWTWDGTSTLVKDVVGGDVTYSINNTNAPPNVATFNDGYDDGEGSSGPAVALIDFTTAAGIWAIVADEVSYPQEPYVAGSGIPISINTPTGWHWTGSGELIQDSEGPGHSVSIAGPYTPPVADEFYPGSEPIIGIPPSGAVTETPLIQPLAGKKIRCLPPFYVKATLGVSYDIALKSGGLYESVVQDLTDNGDIWGAVAPNADFIERAILGYSDGDGESLVLRITGAIPEGGTASVMVIAQQD
jgi:hypothetical protein